MVIRQSGDSGQLYGSVTSRDIAETLTQAGVEAKRNQIAIDQPIKVLGLHEVGIVLHPDVDTSVVINVARTEEEAERQAAGEDVTVESFDDEETIEAAEVFEEGVDVDLSEEAEEEATEEVAEEAADEAATEEASEETEADKED